MRAVLWIALALVVAQATELRKESNDERRARIAEEVSRDKRWRLLERDDYFALTNVTDRDVVDELVKRAEATRAEVKWLLTPLPGGTAVPTVPDPSLPRSKTVLRVHAKAATYVAGGGVAHTYGYYSPEGTEIVLCSSSVQAERAEMLRTAEGLVAREVLDTQLPRGAHAAWFESGLEGYFAHSDLRWGKLTGFPSPALADAARAALHAHESVPLLDLVTLQRDEFDGRGARKLDADGLRTEAWMFVWFLTQRAGGSVPRAEMLDRYVEQWRAKPDAAAATAFAFEGVDWAVLEREWRAYIEAIKD